MSQWIITLSQAKRFVTSLNESKKVKLKKIEKNQFVAGLEKIEEYYALKVKFTA